MVELIAFSGIVMILFALADMYDNHKKKEKLKEKAIRQARLDQHQQWKIDQNIKRMDYINKGISESDSDDV